MKFVDINDCLYDLYDKDIKIDLEVKKEGRVYYYNFILTVCEEKNKTEDYCIEYFSWGEHSYLPKEMEILKEYYRFELSDMMKYYNEFLLYLFYRKQNEDFIYDCKCKVIRTDDEKIPIGIMFDKYLKKHHSFDFESLNEIKDYMKRIRK